MEKNKNKVPSGSGSMTCDSLNSKIVNPDGGSQQVYHSLQFAKESRLGGYSEQKKEIVQDLNDFIWRDYLLNKDRAATLLTTGCIIHSDEGDGEPWERFCLEIDFKDGKDEWEKLKQAGFKEGDKVRIKIEKIKP